MANPNTNTNHSNNGNVNTNQSSNASDSIAQQMRERAERHKRRERERLSAHQNQPNHQNRQNRGSRRNQNQNQNQTRNQNQSYRPNQGSRGRLSAMRSQSNPEHDSSQNRLHAHNSPPSNIQSEFSQARLPDVAPNRGSTFISESPVSEQQQNVESDYEYALRLQQQFEAMNTEEADNRHDHGHHGRSSNHNSDDFNPYHPLPQDPDSGDVMMFDNNGNAIDSVAADSINAINQIHGIPIVQPGPAESHVSNHNHSHSHSNSHGDSHFNSHSPSHSHSHSQSHQSTIDRDHEIALRLQREYDQQMQQIEDAQRRSQRRSHRQFQNPNFVPIEQIPDSSSSSNQNPNQNRGGFTSTFTINRNGNTQTFSFGNGNGLNRNGNGNDPFAAFNHPFFRNQGVSMNSNDFFNDNGFDDDFFRDAHSARIRSMMNRGQPTAINLQPLQMNFLMGNGGFGAFGDGASIFDLMQGPPPPVANQEDIDATTSLDTYRVSQSKKKKNDSNANGNANDNGSGLNGKEEAPSDDDENKEDEGGKETCSICLEPFKDGDQIRRLPCFHIFHQHEIDRWLKTGNDKCPICRVPIDGQLRNQ